MASDPYLPPGCTNRDIDGPEAEQEGFDAYHNGLPIEENPYEYGTVEYDEWREGWITEEEADWLEEQEDNHA